MTRCKSDDRKNLSVGNVNKREWDASCKVEEKVTNASLFWGTSCKGDELNNPSDVQDYTNNKSLMPPKKVLSVVDNSAKIQNTDNKSLLIQISDSGGMVSSSGGKKNAVSSSMVSGATINSQSDVDSRDHSQQFTTQGDMQDSAVNSGSAKRVLQTPHGSDGREFDKDQIIPVDMQYREQSVPLQQQFFTKHAKGKVSRKNKNNIATTTDANSIKERLRSSKKAKISKDSTTIPPSELLLKKPNE